MAFKFGLLNPLKLRSNSKNSKKKRKPVNKKQLLIITGYVLLAILLSVSVVFAWYSKDLPTPEKIAKMTPSQSTKIYDRNNKLLYETGDLKRTLVTSGQITENIKEATVSVEDQSFYQNHGIDPKGVTRAAIHDIFHIGSGSQGGSTITQQYVKNALLYSNQTISRKIKEAILAIELEFMYSKDQILTMYLNEIPYGGQAAGIEAASMMYYGKSAKDLDLAQAATLAAIPKAPSYYSPYSDHVDKLIIRKDYVLDQMAKMKYITQAQATAAKKEDTTTVGTTVQPRAMSILAPHFSLYIMQQAEAQFGANAVNIQGLSITTSLDYNTQVQAQQAVTGGMAKVQKYGGSNGALVAIDPKTGEVLAMVGSADYFNTAIDGNVNIATSLRQPGSSFKPYVYATALKQPDFSPSRILFDLTTTFGGNYTPHDYDNKNRGPVTLRQALDNSLNIPAVKTTDLVGIPNILTTAKDVGITSLTTPSRYGDSLGLGVAEVSLLEHTNGFATFADNGVHHDIHPMLKVTDNSGKTLYEYKPDEDKGKQALDPQIAYELQNVMSDNSARNLVFGLNTPLKFTDRPVGAKTGTTTDFKDAWTLGYTPSLTVGVWVGNNNNKAMSSGADGVVVAAPIFHQFMTAAMAGKPVEQFVAPTGIQTLTVEKWSNLLPTQYTKETTTDIFASWQVPTKQDNVNVAVLVCKVNGLPAPANAPAPLTETKVFSNVHSERPDNSAWEGPVVAWATGAGLYAPPPAGTCDVSNLAPAIAVSLTSPADGSTVSGNNAITAITNYPSNTAKVEFFIDNNSVGSTTTSPYTIDYGFDSLSVGRHVLDAVATDNNGGTAKSEISFFTGGTFSISGVSSSHNSITAQIFWTTSAPGTSQVFYDTPDSHPNYNDYVSRTSPDATLVTNHSVSLSPLIPSTTYHYRVVSKNAGGDIVSSEDYTFTTAP